MVGPQRRAPSAGNACPSEPERWSRAGDGALIPVYVSIVLAMRTAIAGGTQRFLERAAVVQWGLTICVYFVSCVPALLTLRIPGFEGQNVRLLYFLVFVVQLSDVLQYVWGKTIGRRPLAGLDVLGLALGRGAETGRAIHLSAGGGAIGSRSGTAETVAGLLAAASNVVAQRRSASSSRGTGFWYAVGVAPGWTRITCGICAATRTTGLSAPRRPSRA